MFGELFQKCGRVDLKYNSSIQEEDMHFDKQDMCHQVIFTLGRSKESLYVKETVKTTEVNCHRLPTAFDGRFQHWVANHGAVRDRIAVVCYIVDVPSSFKHEKMSVEDLRTKYSH